MVYCSLIKTSAFRTFQLYIRGVKLIWLLIRDLEETEQNRTKLCKMLSAITKGLPRSSLCP